MEVVAKWFWGNLHSLPGSKLIEEGAAKKQLCDNRKMEQQLYPRQTRAL